MGRTPLKGVDAFLARRRPAIRLATYVAICLASIINLGMISSSWGNARFMRQNGAFVGATNVSSSVVTMVVSGLYATATLQQIQARGGQKELSMFCERLTSDMAERIISCLLATWWLSMSVNVSNMAYIYRNEIKICIKMTIPKRRLNGVSKEAAAAACRVFHGSLLLNWILCLFWAIRSWRTFTRESVHFDSTIFKEPSESTMDLYASKLVNTVPDVNNNSIIGPDGSSPGSQHIFNQGYIPDGSQHPRQAPAIPQELPNRQPTQLGSCKMCSCSDCKSSQQSVFNHGQSPSAEMYRILANDAYDRALGSQQQQQQQQQQPITVPLPTATTHPPRSNLSAAAGYYSRGNHAPPVVGTATLVTEHI
ncbi:hypothetical protein IW140_003145 [Coemansia sp. RSA 1813]|nr:hypothetical protein EV179_003021 [Coemansia sp. RSA 487]KAJ2569300.1 hypothetical protein IW140_003145 [Coemansia sp. RSA 1813]